MDLITSCHLRGGGASIFPLMQPICFSGSAFYRVSCQAQNFSSVFKSSCPYSHILRNSWISNSKKRNSQHESVVKPSLVEEVTMDDADIIDGDEFLLDDLADGELVDDDEYFEDDNFAEDAEPHVGDGGGGGGVSLAGTWWDKEVLAIAEEVVLSFNGDIGIYAFKTLSNSTIQVRIEKLSDYSGSPSMMDIEVFSSTYRTRLDEAEIAGSIPNNISLEVSSPGVERILRIPGDLDRFKNRPMYVKYVGELAEAGGVVPEHEGVFRLLSFDLEAKCCSWGLADVRINREKAGKGRPLSEKQRDWRLDTPFDSLRLVRLYSEL